MNRELGHPVGAIMGVTRRPVENLRPGVAPRSPRYAWLPRISAEALRTAGLSLCIWAGATGAVASGELIARAIG